VAYIWEIIIKHPQTDGFHVSLLITYPSRKKKSVLVESCWGAVELTRIRCMCVQAFLLLKTIGVINGEKDLQSAVEENRW